MKRNYAMILGSLLATASMAQWEQVGLEGVPSTLGGVQVVDGSVYFHAAQDNGIMYRSPDMGATWEPLRYAQEGVSWKYLGIKRARVVVHGEKEKGAQGIYLLGSSMDSWQELGIFVNNAEATHERLVASTDQRGSYAIIVSDENGTTWSPSSPVSGDVEVRLIGKDGQDRLLAQAFSDGNHAVNDPEIGLFRSADGGDTWERISAEKHDLTGASAHADHSIYASNGLRILKSTNDGAKWAVLSVNFPYSGLTGSRIYNMGGGHLFFMCHQQGATVQGNLYESLDHGSSWTPVQEEISQHLIYNMARDAHGNLFAATSNGVYRMELAVATSVDEVKPAVAVHAYPVPTSDNVIVNAGGAMINELRVYDMSSREVLMVPQVNKPAELVHVGHLSPGVYLLRAVTRKGIATTHLVVE